MALTTLSIHASSLAATMTASTDKTEIFLPVTAITNTQTIANIEKTLVAFLKMPFI
jgi:hypothetical protein